MQSLATNWFLTPMQRLLCAGLSPEKLAWSLAAGLIVGINPVLGTTTLLALSIAAMFRLNQVAAQFSIHVMYPVQLLMFPVFIKLGSLLFVTRPIPLEGKELFCAVQHHPLATTRLLWTWEWHAFIVWAAFALLATPLLAIGLTPTLSRLCHRVNRRSLPAAMELSA